MKPKRSQKGAAAQSTVESPAAGKPKAKMAPAEASGRAKSTSLSHKGPKPTGPDDEQLTKAFAEYTPGHPRPGQIAPAFFLIDDTGNRFSSRKLEGTWTVLYFYPRDNTPGCTREAIAFQQAAPSFAQRGAAVVGVSRDSVNSHCGFKNKHGLAFTLLSDPDSEVHRLFGALGEKTMYGRTTTGVLRTTVLIRPDGRIARVFPRVKVDGHAQAVLAAIDEEQVALGPHETEREPNRQSSRSRKGS